MNFRLIPSFGERQPVYSADGSVYFSDIRNNRIMRFMPGKKPGARGSPRSFGPPPDAPMDWLSISRDACWLAKDPERAGIVESRARRRTVASPFSPTVITASD